MTENTHALLAPSGAHKWMHCPGSLAMERDIPNESSEFADEGTAGHELAAQCLIHQQPTRNWVGDSIKVGSRTFIVDTEFAETVQTYLDMVNQRIEDYYKAGAISVTLEVEQRVPIDHITGEVDATGTSDVVLLVEFPDYGLIEVIDLKMGRGVAVSAVENPQGQMYALGALRKFALLGDFSRIRITIHQPRLSTQPSEWECSVEDLLRFGSRAAAAASHAMSVYLNEKPEAYHHHLTAGDHCRKSFCRARGMCPKYRDAAMAVMLADFDEFDSPAELEQGDHITAFTSDGTATPEAVAQVMEKPARILRNADDALLDALFPHLDLVDDWLRQVRAHIEARLLAGAQFENVKLVQGKQGNRKWNDEAEAEATLKRMRLKMDQMYEFKLISPTTAEKVLKSTPKRWAKMQALISRSKGGIHVAPIDDPREALVIKPSSDDFEDVSELA